MDKWVVRKPRNVESSNTPNVASNSEADSSSKRPRIMFSLDDVIADPGLRKPIEEYDVGIRDQVRREYLIKGPFQPRGHDFPKKQYGQEMRGFREVWFKDFNWLEYSVSKDEAYCLWCYLFRRPRGGKSGGDKFTSTGFSHWKKAVGVFVEHVGAHDSAHNEARRLCEALENQRQSVSHMLSAHGHDQENAYRIHLTAVLDAIRYLLGQGLAFRGHDESESSIRKGNFLELLNVFCQRDENVAKTLNTNAPGNNQMTSPKVQKEMVSACAAQTTLAIIKEIGDKFYSLMVDESRDNSVKEQMAVVLRYVDIRGHVIERFLGVEHILDTCSESLKKAIDKLFARHGLSISRLRGQGYDGASNMRGEFNGLKAIILRENPSATYIHCFAHQLQLVIVGVTKNNLQVGEFFDYTSKIVNMVGASCKRKDALRQSCHEKIVERLDKGEISSGRGKNQETSLARPGDTRWGSYHLTIIRLFTMWSSVLEVLEDIKDNGTLSEQRSLAMGLMDKMDSFEFVFTMHLLKNIMGITNELSQALQRKDQDIVNAMGLVEVVKEQLQELREIEWDGFLEEVKTFCVDHSISVPNMEDIIPIRSRSRRGGQPITYFHHFRVEVFCQVIDLIIQEMDNRFTEASTELLLCIACLDPKDSFSAFDHVKLCRLAELYPEDFTVDDRLILKSQLNTYIRDVRRNDAFSRLQDIGDLAVKMVETKKNTLFPLVYRLIELTLVLPVATASVERVFSAMKIIKSDLRNRMGDDWMNDCMIVYIEQEVFKTIENEAILQHFQKMQSRRIQLSSFSSST